LKPSVKVLREKEKSEKGIFHIERKEGKLFLLTGEGEAEKFLTRRVIVLLQKKKGKNKRYEAAVKVSRERRVLQQGGEKKGAS